MTGKKKSTLQNPLAKRAMEALKRAGLLARKIARMHGTPIYYMRDGKLVAEKP
jgi:hypothetical protein